MWEYVRAVQDLRPRWVLWENVVGALQSEHGEAFRQLLSSLDDIGYGLAWRVLDAQFFGVAQRRRRVFLVGCLGDPHRAAEVLLEPEGMCRDAPSSREKRAQLASCTRNGAPLGSRGCVGFCYKAGSKAQGIGLQEEVAPTLKAATLDTSVMIPVCFSSTQANAEMDEDMSPTLTCLHEVPGVADGMELRRLTPTECERLQGFPDGWTDIEFRGARAKDTPRYKALGNSMAVPVMAWIGERIKKAGRKNDSYSAWKK